jgi:hypothetical protein
MLPGLHAPLTEFQGQCTPQANALSRFPDARCLLDARDAAASLGKYAWNALEIFRRLSPFGTSALSCFPSPECRTRDSIQSSLPLILWRISNKPIQNHQKHRCRQDDGTSETRAIGSRITKAKSFRTLRGIRYLHLYKHTPVVRQKPPRKPENRRTSNKGYSSTKS